MHLIQSLKNEFCFNLRMFSKYPATSINSYFYKMTLIIFIIIFFGGFSIVKIYFFKKSLKWFQKKYIFSTSRAGWWSRHKIGKFHFLITSLKWNLTILLYPLFISFKQFSKASLMHLTSIFLKIKGSNTTFYERFKQREKL